MKYLGLALILQFLFTAPTIGQKSKPAYQIFNSKGKKVKYEKMIKDLGTSELIFFGEEHDSPISHWLQLEVTQDLDKQHDLILGAEMFERDNQDELELYLQDSIDYKGLDTLARLWKNYKTDYAPLVDYAKENDITFVGTNIPRRFASMVFREGFEALDSLNEEEKSWIAPLPITFNPHLPKYQQILEMLGDHGTPELVKAQATKDATMAHFIIQNMRENTTFIHYNGSYHSDDYEGIVWYVKLMRPKTNFKTITTVSQADVCKLEEEALNRADYIIVVDEDMTRTY